MNLCETCGRKDCKGMNDIYQDECLLYLPFISQTKKLVMGGFISKKRQKTTIIAESSGKQFPFSFHGSYRDAVESGLIIRR